MNEFKITQGTNMFEIGSYVVCPGHGVGQINNLETKELGGEEMSFYIIKVTSNGMTVMVPCNNKNGVRELISNLFLKKKIYHEQKGFMKIEGHTKDSQITLPNKIINENIYLNEIILFLKTNDFNVVFYTAPFRNNTKNLDYIDKLNKKIPNLFDFSTSLQDETLFNDGSHLNYNGAVFFTEILTQKILLQN